MTSNAAVARAYPPLRPAPRPVVRHVVCVVGEIPAGGSRAFKVAGRRILVVHLSGGGYRAVADTCPHEAVSFGKGKVERMWVGEGVGETRQDRERCVVICPWHNFEFDLETGLSVCEPNRMRLKTYRAEAQRDKVVVYA